MLGKTMRLIVKLLEKLGVYKERIAGDNLKFRYPHLEALSKYFYYDYELDSFILKDNADVVKVVSLIAINEITVYELMNQKAKSLHLNDLLGYKSSDKEKIFAFISVLHDFICNSIRGMWAYSFSICTLDINKINIKKEFNALTGFIKKFKQTKGVFVRFDSPSVFQFGSTLKGTNIVFVDDNLANFKQETFHCNYHIEEGIKGFNDDNENIIEVWADVPWLYLKQLVDGRISRRIRTQTSPHDIKFHDYIFLRAYISQAFEMDKFEQQFSRNTYHSVFALIEPSVKLMKNAMVQLNPSEKNAAFIDAICYDKTECIKTSINDLLGANAFELIYNNFNLFDRIKTINSVCEKAGIEPIVIYKMMFNNERLLDTLIDYRLAALIWLSDRINQNRELVVDLVESFSLSVLKSQKKTGNPWRITIEMWISYIGVRYPEQKYQQLVKEEYKKYEDVINNL